MRGHSPDAEYVTDVGLGHSCDRVAASLTGDAFTREFLAPSHHTLVSFLVPP